MKNKFLLVLIFCSTYLCGQTLPEKVILNSNPNSIELISATEEVLIMELSVGNYLKKSININGQEYFDISLIEESILKEKGNPELPKFTRSILIPENANYTANILSSNYIDISLPVKPSKGILSRIVNPDDVPYSFSSLYSTDIFYPNERYSFEKPYLIRNSRGVAINIYPFAYNPVKRVLRIYTSLELEIIFTGSGLKSSSNKPVTKNKYFEPIFNNHFINYKSASNLKSARTVEESSKMLIICYDDFINEMQGFANHKNNRGLTTEIVKISRIGTTATAVKNYIQNKYNSDKSLTFVLLVGDNAQIPTHTVKNGGSDPSYSLVSGDDKYPDIIIGRFSAENKSQVETMVERSITYENMSEQNWFHTGAVIASNQGTGDDNEFDYEHLRNIRADLLSWHYNNIDEFYDGSQGGNDTSGNPNPSMVKNCVNNGVSVINYTGHGSTTSWATSGFSNTDINALTNDNALPFIFSVACVNGNFKDYTCFAESWLRATNNTTKKPTGAIGFYGSSINQSWSPPMEAQDEFNKLLAKEDFISFGALCYNASCSMIDAYGSGGETMFLTWHIFGDPSINVIPNSQAGCMEAITISESLNGGNHEFLANDTITASNKITNGAAVHFGANNSIILTNGFVAYKGCNFVADAEGCNLNPVQFSVATSYKPTIDFSIANERDEKESSLLPDFKPTPTIKIYPNPISNGSLQLDILNYEKPISIRIYSSMGKLIYVNNNPSSKQSISSINEKGLLFIKIKMKDSTIIKKIISK